MRLYRLNLEYEPQLLPAPRSLLTTGPMGKSNMAPERTLNLAIDSGASFHIVNDPNILINKRPSNETISGVDRREVASTAARTPATFPSRPKTRQAQRTA